MGHAIAFYTLSALILGFAVAVITARNAVHSVLFLVANFLFVAGLYVTLGAQFLAIIQVLVYAGGIVVLYLFVVMLVKLKQPIEAHEDRRRLTRLGVALAVLLLAEVVAIGLWSLASPLPAGDVAANVELVAANVEQVGLALYTDYLIPFEVASILLLVAMVGAIVLARRQL
jgi:NADH-quinone oxidoreductase subunit J